MPSSYAAAPDSGADTDARPILSASSSLDHPTLAGSTPRNGSTDRDRETAPDLPDNGKGRSRGKGKGMRKIAELFTGTGRHSMGNGNGQHDANGVSGDDAAAPGARAGDEQSPLLTPEGEADAFIDQSPHTIASNEEELQATKSIWYLLLLTIGIGGLQIAWSVELSNGSPYLLSLGLSKSLMALVWIAGPLSGTLVQPYVGMLSDNCRIPWGKRKPFMVGGAAATVASLLMLAWTKEIVGGSLGLFGADPESKGVKVSIIVVAVIWVYILDFAINTVQAAIRAFIVDCAPTHQQEAANAMASRIVGVGNIIGYLAGYVKLDNFAWFLGTSQFKQLCAIASIALIVTVLLSVLFIKERDPRLEGPPSRNKAGVLAFFRSIFGSIQRLPPEIKKVCIVQFCAWIGFFPMLFYTSQYIAEIYAEPYFEENPNMTDDEITKLYEKATRVGTFALLIFSITSLITNVFLPFFIAPTYDSQPFEIGEGPGQTAAVPLHDYFETEQKSWLDYLVIPGFTLRRAWMYAQILFTVCMLCTVFVRTVAVATVLIGLVGITWALTLWAPWAIISAEISRRDAVTRAQKHRNFSHVSDGEAQDNDRPSLDGYSDNGEDISTAEEGGLRKAKDEPEDADQAGVILGIHNMAIAAPQIIATVVSSIIFRFFQKKRGEPGDHSIAIVMALGGIAVLVSAWFIHRIKESASLPAADLEEAILNAIDEGEMGGIGAVGGDGPHGPGSRPRTPGTPGTPGTLPSRPSTAHSRRQSHESLPRLSLQRATLARSQSFGGAEY